MTQTRYRRIPTSVNVGNGDELPVTMRSTLECLPKKLQSIRVNRLRDGDELRDIQPPLKGLNALDPVRRLAQLLGQLPLGKPRRFPSFAQRSDDGPLASRILHGTPGQ